MVGMDPLHEARTEPKYFYLPNVAARDQTLLPVLISVRGVQYVLQFSINLIHTFSVK